MTAGRTQYENRQATLACRWFPLYAARIQDLGHGALLRKHPRVMDTENSGAVQRARIWPKTHRRSSSHFATPTAADRWR
jgi:hypothetical protein